MAEFASLLNVNTLSAADGNDRVMAMLACVGVSYSKKERLIHNFLSIFQVMDFTPIVRRFETFKRISSSAMLLTGLVCHKHLLRPLS